MNRFLVRTSTLPTPGLISRIKKDNGDETLYLICKIRIRLVKFISLKLWKEKKNGKIKRFVQRFIKFDLITVNFKESIHILNTALQKIDF